MITTIAIPLSNIYIYVHACMHTYIHVYILSLWYFSSEKIGLLQHLPSWMPFSSPQETPFAGGAWLGVHQVKTTRLRPDDWISPFSPTWRSADWCWVFKYHLLMFLRGFFCWFWCWCFFKQVSSSRWGTCWWRILSRDSFKKCRWVQFLWGQLPSGKLT